MDITVLDTSPGGGGPSRALRLHFVSNGLASRMAFDAAASIARVLYPDAHFPSKHVDRITIALAIRNLTRGFLVAPGDAAGEFVILLSPVLVAAEADARAAVGEAVRRGVAQVLLFDGGGAAPEGVVDAMVEHLAAGGGEWGCLRRCEEQRPGFVARLNRGMREGWPSGDVVAMCDDDYGGGGLLPLQVG